MEQGRGLLTANGVKFKQHDDEWYQEHSMRQATAHKEKPKIIEQRKNMGGCSACMISIFLIGMGSWFLHLSQSNRRDEELHDYLNSIKNWNENYGVTFGGLDVGILN